jgi:alkanesulfonate monooxygenase SsuD/methylene tetrahydromethanopterin reductase-like flavin-dependent oxidoreductase (luciferase family)
MLRLAAELADQWQTAWFGLPDERYRDRRRAILAACDAVGRDPATLGVTVGIEIDPSSDGATSLPLEVDAIAAALTAWDGEGADHLQLGIWPANRTSFTTVLDAIAGYRASA